MNTECKYSLWVLIGNENVLQAVAQHVLYKIYTLLVGIISICMFFALINISISDKNYVFHTCM